MIDISPTINQTMFTSELSRVSITGLSDYDSVTITIERNVGANHEVILDNQYTPVNGEVVLYDIDRLLTSYMQGECTRFTIFVGKNTGISYQFIAIACDGSVSEPAETFTSRSFLTANQSPRDTAIGRRELMPVYQQGESTPTVEAEYITDSYDLATRVYQLSPVNGVAAIDVSPALFNDITAGMLVGYTVSLGKRKASYRVLAHIPESDTSLIFHNRFGAWEVMHLSGRCEVQPSYNRSQAMVGGSLVNYDIVETISYKAMTGPLRHGMEAVVMDMARSREVYLLASDGTTGQPVAITDTDIKLSPDNDGIADMTVTYRLASRHTYRLEVARPPKLFDDTYDDTYD